ncbi:MAG: DUF3179 domain-containing protein [Nitrospinaceae bacterium]|nr:DUF3179 domain-containing protein [Nitrospinaceae bacterium]NIR54273.1 DUF3179 domain-containing protein [Nitrospinaceae bacterium]NIS84690.1 DUF3179 domain-containing protein [Nitrospinaceae bacterium]NIT81485.1 DUF3179 domain-containing protein [Nitrospinaceae bacterium]NIU43769.1 DUF3179 domain-containing protein [Nitrospinaceae bacterium]
MRQGGVTVKSLGVFLLWVGLAAWDFSKSSIPLDEIVSGGPPKDGIPALDRPRFVSAKKASRSFMKDRDRVIGLTVNGKAKAYPIKILNWHEIVNDRLGGRNVVVTFCPLCGTGMVFDAKAAGRVLTFGVSGLLYKSDVLMYDRQTESLWSQIKQQAVTGPMTGTSLTLLTSTHTRWDAWRKRYPETFVLSTQTGHVRDYDRDPYAGYAASDRVMFSVGKLNRQFHPKEPVIGVKLNGVAKAYPFSELAKMKSPFKDRVGEKTLWVVYDAPSRTATIKDASGREVPTVTGFWFAWYAFHKDTQVFTAGK